MRVVLIGPPGAGKGTQGPLLAAALCAPQVAVGDLFRAEAASGSDLGARLAAIMATGALVPDDVAIAVVERALRPATDGFVLDGFPRTTTQAHALDRFLQGLGAEVDVVLHFDVPDAELLRRLDGRGRADDSPDLAARRLALHRASEQQLLAHYRGRIVELDAVGPAEEVYDRALHGLREAARVV